jgi:tRNA-specific 2-thiouridylase
MDVCFITRGGREQFLESRVGARPGAIVDTTGGVVGNHRGVATFTVGQRRGVGVALGERRYVVDVDAATATVTIGTRSDLERSSIAVRDWTFVDRALLPAERVQAQLRAHGEALDATLDGERVSLAIPQPRVAPGQVVALYDGDVLLGGGLAR